MYNILMIITNILNIAVSLPNEIVVVGLFDESDSSLKTAFQAAVNQANSKRITQNTRLIAVVESIPENDSFYTARKVCQHLPKGVLGIFGPRSRTSSRHIQDICNKFQIPYLETYWRNYEIRPPMTLNLYPHYSTVNQAFWDFIKVFNWKDYFSVIYDTEREWLKIQGLLNPLSNYRVKVYQLHAFVYRSTLQTVRDNGERQIVLVCDSSKIQPILRAAQQLSMTTKHYSYFIFSLDFHTIDLKEFYYSGTAIKAFRLVDPTRTLGATHMMTEEALIYDAVESFTRGLQILTKQYFPKQFQPITCQNTAPWPLGSSLMSHLKGLEFQGLSGHINFDEDGYRRNVTMQVLELSSSGLIQAGTWVYDKYRQGSTRLTMNPNYTTDHSPVFQRKPLSDQTLTVGTILQEPFIMQRDDKNLHGKERFYGYCIDLLERLANDLGFNYTLKLVEDGRYGSVNKDGDWDGMIGELIHKKVDIVIAPITVTSEREKVVDFTRFFMKSGIGILMKRPDRDKFGMLLFLAPFSAVGWICIIVAFLLMAFLFYFINRFSPIEKENSDMQKDQKQINIFSDNCWFIMQSFTLQGSSKAFHAYSSRFLSCIWWIFTLILISAYIANMVALLTVDRRILSIKNLDDLSKQTKVKALVLASGSTNAFFRESHISVFNRVWENMAADPSESFVKTFKDGLNKVKKGNYAFLAEMAMLEYVVERDCDLVKVGPVLTRKDYAIATPRNSPLRDIFSASIVEIEEKDSLKFPVSKDKWWKGMKKHCSKNIGVKDQITQLNLTNVGGVFLFLLFGILMSIIAIVLEKKMTKKKT